MTRTLVMGDPQAPFAKVLEILALHDALDGNRLAKDVVLVSIGDHFDYDLRNHRVAAQEGLSLLRWLASHDASQVVLILGNHDASRVMELAAITDEEFERARQLARSIDDTEQSKGKEAARERTQREYLPAFPTLPPPGVVGRDYAAFSSEQRELVQTLLLAARFHLACTGELPDGRRVLLSHAGVTTRETSLLGVDTSPVAIAQALEARLAGSIERVSEDWRRGEVAPLSLAPLHVSGSQDEEGGGLLYHRPSNPQRKANPQRKVDAGWAHAPARPRRFDPRTLPRGLTQVVGHTGHAKCVEELGDWVTPRARARAHGGIRTLRVLGDSVTYDLGIAPPTDGVADLILIDGEMRRVDALEVSLLPLASLDAMQ